MGKTLLARRILDALEEEVFEAALLVMHPGAAGSTSILQRFARQFGCEEPSADRGVLLSTDLRAARDRPGGRPPRRTDDRRRTAHDAHGLCGALRSSEPRVRGQTTPLDALRRLAGLDKLVQNVPGIMPRVDVRVRLQPLDMANAAAYLHHRLDAVGANAAILPSAAMEALFKFGRGRPRLLNTLADNALFEAYLAGRSAIDATDVERAASDLVSAPTRVRPTPSSRPLAPVGSDRRRGPIRWRDPGRRRRCPRRHAACRACARPVRRDRRLRARARDRHIGDGADPLP